MWSDYKEPLLGEWVCVDKWRYVRNQIEAVKEMGEITIIIEKKKKNNRQVKL